MSPEQIDRSWTRIIESYVGQFGYLGVSREDALASLARVAPEVTTR